MLVFSLATSFASEFLDLFLLSGALLASCRKSGSARIAKDGIAGSHRPAVCFPFSQSLVR